MAEAHGATVLRLPFNVGIGGAVQTGFRYARDEGYERRRAARRRRPARRLRARQAARAARAGRAPISSSARASSIRAARTDRRSPAGSASVCSRDSSRCSEGSASRTRRPASSRSTGPASSCSPPSTRTTIRRSRPRSSRVRSGLRLAQVQVDMRERQAGYVLDHVRPLALLHRQGHARPAHREPAPLSAARGGAAMTPIRASVAGASPRSS